LYRVCRSLGGAGLRSGYIEAHQALYAGKWELAAHYYRRGLAEEPRSPAIWVQYGHMLKLCGQLDEAEEAYRQSLRLDPNHADTYAQLGHVLTLQNRPAAAAEAYRCALALDATLENAIAGVRALDAPDKECRRGSVEVRSAPT
jgi:predicted Zn-dependent protease